jgi:hypothetical protein
MNEQLVQTFSGFAGAIVGGLIVVIGQHILSELLRGRSARYAAMRIVCTLGEFSGKCIDVAFDDGTSNGRPAGRTSAGEALYVPQVDLPKKIQFPDDIDWKSMDAKLMYGALKISNDALSAVRYIAFVEENFSGGDQWDIIEERRAKYAALGLQALRLTKSLCMKYKIPMGDKDDIDANWDPEQRLTQVIQDVRDKQRRGAQESAKILDAGIVKKE